MAKRRKKAAKKKTKKKAKKKAKKKKRRQFSILFNKRFSWRLRGERFFYLVISSETSSGILGSNFSTCFSKFLFKALSNFF